MIFPHFLLYISYCTALLLTNQFELQEKSDKKNLSEITFSNF
ncbi:hypothetical protein SanJ4211_0819c [Streptococcus anginosus]|nr:hypothetical protein SanJ4211_0819c [Streptococcus anginosus]BBD42482.1 hypothetical protein SA27298_1014 [Streptococcus anginosus]